MSSSLPILLAIVVTLCTVPHLLLNLRDVLATGKSFDWLIPQDSLIQTDILQASRFYRCENWDSACGGLSAISIRSHASAQPSAAAVAVSANESVLATPEIEAPPMGDLLSPVLLASAVINIIQSAFYCLVVRDEYAVIKDGTIGSDILAILHIIEALFILNYLALVTMRNNMKKKQKIKNEGQRAKRPDEGQFTSRIALKTTILCSTIIGLLALDLLVYDLSFPSFSPSSSDRLIPLFSSIPYVASYESWIYSSSSSATAGDSSFFRGPTIARMSMHLALFLFSATKILLTVLVKKGETTVSDSSSASSGNKYFNGELALRIMWSFCGLCNVALVSLLKLFMPIALASHNFNWKWVITVVGFEAIVFLLLGLLDSIPVADYNPKVIAASQVAGESAKKGKGVKKGKGGKKEEIKSLKKE
jgi:hypothetical protein